LKTYYGDWSANNATSYNREPYEYTNLKEARKSMRAIAQGNTFAGNTGNWSVYKNTHPSMESYRGEEPIAQGVTRN
jgi:hypothetical protein